MFNYGFTGISNLLRNLGTLDKNTKLFKNGKTVTGIINRYERVLLIGPVANVMPVKLKDARSEVLKKNGIAVDAETVGELIELLEVGKEEEAICVGWTGFNVSRLFDAEKSAAEGMNLF